MLNPTKTYKKKISGYPTLKYKNHHEIPQSQSKTYKNHMKVSADPKNFTLFPMFFFVAHLLPLDAPQHRQAGTTGAWTPGLGPQSLW